MSTLPHAIDTVCCLVFCFHVETQLNSYFCLLAYNAPPYTNVTLTLTVCVCVCNSFVLWTFRINSSSSSSSSRSSGHSNYSDCWIVQPKVLCICISIFCVRACMHTQCLGHKWPQQQCLYLEKKKRERESAQCLHVFICAWTQACLCAPIYFLSLFPMPKSTDKNSKILWKHQRKKKNKKEVRMQKKVCF